MIHINVVHTGAHLLQNHKNSLEQPWYKGNTYHHTKNGKWETRNQKKKFLFVLFFLWILLRFGYININHIDI